MHDREPNPKWRHIRAASRWLVAGGVGVAVSVSMFVAMAAAIDGVDIFGRMFRMFPLTQTTVDVSDECGEGGIASHLAVPIEGTVGHLRDGRVDPLFDAEVVGDNALTGETPVDVGEDGSFRFIAAFPNPDPAACRETKAVDEGTPQRLSVRAPGCTERNIPVTAAWVPHAILLDCAARD